MPEIHYNEEVVWCRTCESYTTAYTTQEHVPGWGTVFVHRTWNVNGPEHFSYECTGSGRNVKLELEQAILV